MGEKASFGGVAVATALPDRRQKGAAWLDAPTIGRIGHHDEAGTYNRCL